jgi:uncharacterized protein YerC
MTNVSKDKIDGKDFSIAYRELVSLLSSLNKGNAHIFIDSLCTESEKIMLVKRFAALLLFSHKYSPYLASVSIGISLSTAQRLYRQYESGDFNDLLHCLTKKQKNNFISLLEDFMLSKASGRARTRLLKRALNLPVNR